MEHAYRMCTDHEKNKAELLQRKEKLRAMDASFHPDSDKLLEIVLDFGEDGDGEKLYFIVDLGDGEYDVFDCLEDFINWWEHGGDTSLCTLTKEEYESLEVQ